MEIFLQFLTDSLPIGKLLLEYFILVLDALIGVILQQVYAYSRYTAIQSYFLDLVHLFLTNKKLKQ